MATKKKTKKEEKPVKNTEVINEVEEVKEDEEIKEVKKVEFTKFKNKDNNVTKVDLSQPLKNNKEDGISEQQTEGMDEEESTGIISEVEEEIRVQDTEPTTEEVSIIQEVTDEETTTQEVVEKEPILETTPLPENVDKLVTFMQETGGNIEDYIRLNANYDDVDNLTLLKEYYKNTKSHLDLDEIEFLMDDQFSFDEEVDEERAIRKKKLALKEEVAKAKSFLTNLKDKYYDEIKLRSGVTQEQQKATDFFNRYNQEQQVVQKQHDAFIDATKNYFTGDFKGFEFNLGEKKFRYGINNVSDVADNQSNISSLLGKFLDDKGDVVDYKGYHKAIYAADNADTIAKHFYEQGQADAIKEITAKSKNISDKPRASSPGNVYVGGLKVKAISGIDSSRLKVKQK